jgi:hypothetical protein
MDFDEEAGRVWANIDALCLDAFALDGEELDAHRARYPAAIAAALRGAADEAERRGHEAGMVGWRLSCGLPVSDEAVALDDRLRRERFGEWPPVPKPDEAPNPFARLYGACPDLPEPDAFPMQPIVRDEHGVARFRANPIVRHLLDHGGIDMNAIARLDFPREAREQFAQLIGYSVSGASELDYVSDAVVDAAREQAAKLKGGA